MSNTRPDSPDHVDAVAPTLEGTLRLSSTRRAVAASSALITQEVGNSRYVMRGELGRGGMGAVHVAFDREIRREVALKIVLPERFDPVTISRFVHEAQITGQLQHPHIVPIHELGRTASGQPFFTMKLVHGTTLRERLDQMRKAAKAGGAERVFPLGDRLEVLIKIGQALAFAHSRGVIHRDLKPENIMLGEFGEVLVMDWGLAKVIGHDMAADRGPVSTERTTGTNFLSRDGAVSGTPAYMAPEQAAGDIAEQDAQTDVFALGALLYEMLTLTPPYRGASVLETVTAARAGKWEPVAQRAARMWQGALRPPQELAAIAQKALSPRKSRRYASIEALLDDVKNFIAHQPVTARPDSPLTRLVKWTRRHPQLTLAGGLLLVVSLLTVLWQMAEQSAALAEAQARQSEALAKQNAALAKQAAAEADAAAQRAVLAEAAEAERRGERDTVRHLLLKLGVDAKNQAITDLLTEWRRIQAMGKTDFEIAATLGATRLHGYLTAFNRLIETASETGYTVTAEDWYWRAVLRFFTGDKPGAITDYTRAIQLSPGVFQYFFNRALTHNELGHQADAEADYTEAIRLDPRQPQSYINRAFVRMDMGQLDAAIADFNLAAQVAPNPSVQLEIAICGRGNARLRKREFALAIADYDAVLAMSPRHNTAWGYRGQAKLNLNDFTGALEDMNEALRLTPTRAESYDNRGLVYFALRDYPRAILDHTEALRLRPNHALSHAYRGSAFAYHGDFHQAMLDYDRACKLDPTNWQIWYRRFDAHLACKDRNGAITSLRESLRLCPDAATKTHLVAKLRELGAE